MSDSWKSEMHYSDWWVFVSGCCGLLGILGLWLQFIYQDKLDKVITSFNWLVSILILIGVFAVFWSLFGLGLALPIADFQDVPLPLLLFFLAGFGCWFAYNNVKPNKKIKPFALLSGTRGKVPRVPY